MGCFSLLIIGEDWRHKAHAYTECFEDMNPNDKDTWDFMLTKPFLKKKVLKSEADYIKFITKRDGEIAVEDAIGDYGSIKEAMNYEFPYSERYKGNVAAWNPKEKMTSVNYPFDGFTLKKSDSALFAPVCGSFIYLTPQGIRSGQQRLEKMKKRMSKKDFEAAYCKSSDVCFSALKGDINWNKQNEKHRTEYRTDFQTYAVITDDLKWYEAVAESGKWNLNFFDTFIKDLSDNIRLTLVDARC